MHFFFSEVIDKHQLDFSDVNAKISLLESDECTDPNKNDKLKDLRARKTELINLMDVALEAGKIDLRKRESKDQRQLKELLESIEELEVEISNMKAEITDCGDEGTKKSLRKK